MLNFIFNDEITICKLLFLYLDVIQRIIRLYLKFQIYFKIGFLWNRLLKIK